MTRSCLVLCCTLAACSLYGNTPPPPTVCAGGDIPAAPQQRDPQTGSCEPVYQCCDDPCVPCGCGSDPQGLLPSCSGPCEGLTETTCLATAGCHAAYLDTLSPGSGSDVTAFWACWDIAPLTPQESSNCTALDALDCVQTDNCTSTYAVVGTADPTTSATFSTCNTEVTPPPPPACSTLTTAATCTARMDCEPIYDGSDCTCTPSTCTCQVETFDHCQAN
jgi:hypothetical protein